jgi:hypothetical protein
VHRFALHRIRETDCHTVSGSLDRIAMLPRLIYSEIVFATRNNEGVVVAEFPTPRGLVLAAQAMT